MGMRGESTKNDVGDSHDSALDDAKVPEVNGDSEGEPAFVGLLLAPDLDAVSKPLEDNADLAATITTAKIPLESSSADGFVQTEKASNAVIYQLLLKYGKAVIAEYDIEAEGQAATISTCASAEATPRMLLIIRGSGKANPLRKRVS